MIAAAEGYPQYSGSLIKPVMKAQLLSRLTCETAFQELTSGNFMGDFKTCTDTVTMLRPSRAVVRSYQKNQKLEPDYIEASTVSLHAGKAAYFDVKLDDIDDQLICTNPALMAHYTDDALSQFKYLMELDVLGEMMCNVHQYNRGCCAGARSHKYNLGSETKPRETDCTDGAPSDILRLFQDMFTVLAEACAVTPGYGLKISNAGGEPFIALPYAGLNMLQRCMSRCCPSGGTVDTPMVTGRIPTRIQGFHVYILNGIPSSKQLVANGKKAEVFKIIAGRRDATGFIKIVDKVRRIDNDPNYFGVRTQGLTAWGTATLRPEALALANIYFKED